MPSSLMWAGNSQAQAVIAAKRDEVFHRAKGCPSEAVKGNVEKEPLILRVDASKLSHIWYQLKTRQNLVHYRLASEGIKWTSKKNH